MIAWTDTDSVEDPSGEALIVDERLVLAPCSGRFRLTTTDGYAAEGEFVRKGQVVGSVVRSTGEQVPVQSQFAGWMMGYMLPHGAPVLSSEPVLWLRRR